MAVEKQQMMPEQIMSDEEMAKREAEAAALLVGEAFEMNAEDAEAEIEKAAKSAVESAAQDADSFISETDTEVTEAARRTGGEPNPAENAEAGQINADVRLADAALEAGIAEIMGARSAEQEREKESPPKVREYHEPMQLLFKRRNPSDFPKEDVPQLREAAISAIKSGVGWGEISHAAGFQAVIEAGGPEEAKFFAQLCESDVGKIIEQTKQDWARIEAERVKRGYESDPEEARGLLVFESVMNIVGARNFAKVVREHSGDTSPAKGINEQIAKNLLPILKEPKGAGRRILTARLDCGYELQKIVDELQQSEGDGALIKELVGEMDRLYGAAVQETAHGWKDKAAKEVQNFQRWKQEKRLAA